MATHRILAESAMPRSFIAAIVLLVFAVQAKATKLIEAVKEGNLQATEAAIAQGADINEKTGLLKPLVAAFRSGHQAMVELLVEHGADPVGKGCKCSISAHEGLNLFLANPAATHPETSMSFPGLPDEGQRADLILYLRNQSTTPAMLP